MLGGVTAAVTHPGATLAEVVVWDQNISWEIFFDAFSRWPEEKLQRMIPRICDFGDSDEVCEAVCRMPTFALSERLYHRAVCHGVRFSREERLQMGHSPRMRSATGLRAWLEIAIHRWKYY